MLHSMFKFLNIYWQYQIWSQIVFLFFSKSADLTQFTLQPIHLGDIGIMHKLTQFKLNSSYEFQSTLEKPQFGKLRTHAHTYSHTSARTHFLL